MIIRGTAEVDLKEAHITALQGVEKRCAQCKKLFEDNDGIVVFVQTGYTEGSVRLPDDSTYLIHLQGTCLEEFVGSVLAMVKELPVASVASVSPVSSTPPLPIDQLPSATNPPQAG